MEHHLAEFTTGLNCPPIDVLSDDVLSYIFCGIAHATVPSMRDVFAISHTCAHWRAVAISCPDLWRHYVFVGPHNDDRSNELLKRCGQEAILNVGWDRLVGYPDYECMPSKLEIEHLPRIHSYTLLLSRSTVSFLHDLGTPTATFTALEHLTVLRKPPDPGSYVLPDAILGGGRFPLKSLLIFQCRVNLDLVLFNNMQVLDIETECPEGELWRTSGRWVRTLQGCPNLVRLSLNVTLEDSHDSFTNETSDGELISLPKLTVLSLCTPLPSSIHQLLKRTSIPSIRTINIASAYGFNTPPTQLRCFEEALKLIVDKHILPKCPSQGCKLVVDGAARFRGDPSTTFIFSPASLTGVACRATFSGITKAGLALPLWFPIAPYLSTLEFTLYRYSPGGKEAIDSFVPAAPALKFMSSEISLEDPELPDWVSRAPWRLSWGPGRFLPDGVHWLWFGSEETKGQCQCWRDIGDSPTGSITFTRDGWIALTQPLLRVTRRRRRPPQA